MALTVTVNSRKTVHRDEVLTTGKVNAVGLPTVTVTGTAETANIADNAVTAAKAEYGAWHWATASTAGNVITLTTGNSLTGTPAAGTVIAFVADTTTTAAVTVDVDSYTAGVSVQRKDGVALVQDDIVAGQVVEMRYDGGAWQLISQPNNDAILVGEDSSGTDAYAFTASPVVTSYRPGQQVMFKAATANTGPATLNISTHGATAIKKQLDQDLATGDIKEDQWVHVVYDGTNFQLLSPVASAASPVVPGSNENLQLVRGSTAATQMDVTADFISVGNSAGQGITLTAISQTFDITNGVDQDGLDAGSESNSAWYYLYLCRNQTAGETFLLASTNGTAPASTNVAYTHYAPLGVVFNDSSGDLAQFATLRQGIWYFESTAEAMSAAVEKFTWAHPFNRKPLSMGYAAVMGASTEFNYTEGDEVDSLIRQTSGESAVNLVRSTSQLAAIKWAANVAVPDTVTPFTSSTITAASWSLKVYAQF